MRRALVCLILVMFNFCGNAKTRDANDESDEPVIGQLCPDFQFDKSDFFNKGSFALHELRGKWIVLDFWSRFCSACIGNFPHVSEMQQKFGTKLQFLMVTFDDSAHYNRMIFSKYHEEERLQMPCVFNGTSDTSDLFKQCKVGALPFVIIVDPAGIVRAITVTFDETQIQDLLDGKSPSFASAVYSDKRQIANQVKYSTRLPYLVNGNGGPDESFFYRSLLSKWRLGLSRDYVLDFSKGRLEIMGQGITMLYREAYIGFLSNALWEESNTEQYGKVWPDPILEVKDTSVFKEDYFLNKNVFCYSLIVPPSKTGKDKMLQIMQSDLDRYFGYSAVYETRKMPYWKLVVTDSVLVSKLRTKTSDGKTIGYPPVPYLEFEWRNVSMKEFIDFLSRYSGIFTTYSPLIDETNLKDNIDILIKSPSGHLASLNEVLKKNGLEIVKGMKEMKVLVIRDSNDVAGGKSSN
jgi:alkyl hydroperoxide reductase subunit AhpC